MFEQSPAVVLAAVLTIVKGNGGPAKSRGVFCVIVGFLTLIIMDSDSTIQTIHSQFTFVVLIILMNLIILMFLAESHTHHSGLNHLFYHVINWFGLADHKVDISCP